ncbi:MAG: hypothetical protein WD876_02255 [Candidatus Pacearchaeota archaeon]
MKIIEGRCDYERRGSEERTALSLDDMGEEDVGLLKNAIKSEVYLFGKFGFPDVHPSVSKHGSEGKEYLFSSPFGNNYASLSYFERTKKATIFIHGPKAGDIEIRLRKLVAQRGVENSVKGE